MLYIPGLLAVLITEKSQRLGDIAAGTIIIDVRNKSTWQETLFEEVELNYIPFYPQVMKLSDKDINTIKSVVRMGEKYKDNRTVLTVSSRIQEKFGISTEESAVAFLKTLLKDYNYYTRN